MQHHLPFPRHQHHRPPLPLFECAHVKIIYPVVFLQHSQVGLLGQCVPRCAGGDLLVEGVDGVEVVVELLFEQVPNPLVALCHYGTDVLVHIELSDTPGQLGTRLVIGGGEMAESLLELGVTGVQGLVQRSEWTGKGLGGVGRCDVGPVTHLVQQRRVHLMTNRTNNRWQMPNRTSHIHSTNQSRFIERP